MEVIDAGLQTTCLLFISHHQAKIKDLKYFLQFYSTASVVCRMNKQEAKKRIGEEKKAKTWKKMGRIRAEKSRGLGAAMSTRHCSTSSASASGSGTPLDRSLPASSPLSLSLSLLSLHLQSCSREPLILLLLLLQFLDHSSLLSSFPQPKHNPAAAATNETLA